MKFVKARSSIILSFCELCVQADKESMGSSGAYMCLSDFIADESSGVEDYVGMFAVSAGFGSKELCDR